MPEKIPQASAHRLAAVRSSDHRAAEAHERTPVPKVYGSSMRRQMLTFATTGIMATFAEAKITNADVAFIATVTLMTSTLVTSSIGGWFAGAYFNLCSTYPVPFGRWLSRAFRFSFKPPLQWG
jgi:hypothetical protein